MSEWAPVSCRAKIPNKYQIIRRVTMKKLLRIAAAAVLGLGLTTGVVAAQTGTIDTTGPDSDNVIRFEGETTYDVDNNTDLSASNDVDQDATSGDADVTDSTTGGDATTGDAANETDLSVDASVENSADCACDALGNSGDHSASIENTGPDSNNRVVFDSDTTVEIENTVSINIDNNVDQDATSGDANVDHNTTGGDATTGDASNSSSTELMFEVMN
jgi:hypothetical protein